mgnify:CR=1 FL=1
MEETFLTIFQQLAFPVAVSVVLFVFVFYLMKAQKKQQEEYIKNLQEQQNEYIQSLKQTNSNLVAIISDNTKAFNRFSTLMIKQQEQVKKLEEIKK